MTTYQQVYDIIQAALTHRTAGTLVQAENHETAEIAILDYIEALKTSVGDVAVSRYSAYSSGNNNAEVLACGDGITANLANTNELTFTIPTGQRIISTKIRISSVSTLKIFMGTTDMANSTLANRWMPVVQAWREDTGQQLMGMTCAMDISGTAYGKFTVNGLTNTCICQIRISF